MKILVVEDDRISRFVLQTKLRKLGHHVVSAEDGNEGWSAFVREEPGIIITDWMMPNLDGLSLCRRIREQKQEQYTYIIMLTALLGKKSYLEGMGAGADDFLNKPVDLDELTACVRVGERILTLQSEVKQLKGLLPTCAYCKKIRDSDNTWQEIEGYISSRTNAVFSHGYCPDCYERHVVPQLDELKIKRTSAKPAMQ